jgi:hypothetical protein
MNTWRTEFNEKIAAQGAHLPSMYGHLDPSNTPERFAPQPCDQTELDREFLDQRGELLAKQEQVERVRAYTMIGDPVADAYAAMIPTCGFPKLVGMLEQACDHGLESVPSAPPELVRFIQDMERLPDWLDPKLIEQGARLERNDYANKVPFGIRGGFIPTFMNKYSALPMVLTGALSHNSSARRVKETATFFTSVVMPDVLDRHSGAFKSAAMVRLMHSMVRFNLLHGDKWDIKVYGIPIPQIDQLPAGLLSAGRLALDVVRHGRTAFTRTERARVELGRYRCFLLGLPKELLPDTPQGIADLLLIRHATLRKGYDDNCGALVRATMAADFTLEHTLAGRIHAWMERGFAKVNFVPKFLRAGNRSQPTDAIRIGLGDYVGAALAVIQIWVTTTIYEIASHIPIVNATADRSLVRRLTKLLGQYGHAEFKTNASEYRAAHA